MKILKKIFPALFSLAVIVLCLSLLPTEAKAAEITASGTCGDDLTWTLTDDGKLTIAGTGDMTWSGSAPWYRYRSTITSLEIGNNVTSICKSAFYNCTVLESIQFNAVNMTDLYDYSCIFYGAGLSGSGIRVTIGAQVTKIPAYLFEPYSDSSYAPNVVSVEFEDGSVCSSIGSYAFHYCTSLTSIEIPDSVTSIGSLAFSGCTGLTSIEIPENVNSIGKHAFYNCIALENIQFNAVNMTDLSSSNCVFYCAGQSGSGIYVTIGAQVTQIPDYLFCPSDSTSDVPKVVSVEFEDGSVCASIGSSAFYNCTSLTSAEIPDGITSIGSSAFYNCTSLTSAEIPDGITSIGSSAFRYCTSLTSIEIPNSVTSIGTYAFNSCKGLTRIEIPDSVTSIGSYAFQNCTSVASVEIGDGVTSIGTYAFYNCTSLTSVEIGESVTSIDGFAFMNCKALESIRFNAVNMDMNSFNYVFAYAGQSGSGIHLKIGAKVTKIPAFLFYPDDNSSHAPKVVSVEFENGSVCTSVGSYAFYNCTSLSEIQFAGNAPTIRTNSFYSVTATAYYPIADSSWTADVMQNYGGTITWVPCAEGYVQLEADWNTDFTLLGDLYIDLNGYDLSGVITTNGYKVYGMDSTTNTYAADGVGYFNCVDENGNAVVPKRHFKTTAEMTEDIRRYMAIETESGWTFHRFYLGITNTSLSTATTGLGYKAVFYGDDMVKAQLDTFGYTMQLDGFNAVSHGKAADSFVSGKTVTLRINHFDVENYGETALNASVYMQLSDGTWIESAVHTVTFREVLETVNDNYSAYTAQQLEAVAALIEKHDIIQTWKVENLYTPA